MPELNFGDTDEQALIVLKGFAQRVNGDIYNHGKDGLLTRFNLFLTVHETREKIQAQEQTRRHRSNATKINILLALAAVSSVLVGIAAIWVTIYLHDHAGADPLKIFHSVNPVYADRTNSADLPPTFER